VSFQLSTPYLDTENYVLYVLTTWQNGTGGEYYWNLWAVDVTTRAVPTGPIAKGNGQANTPITPNSDTEPDYLYFGAFSGNKDSYYYQYSINPPTAGTLTSFSGSDDFYWTGAAVVSLKTTNDYVVFGGDAGVIYVRPTGPQFATAGAGNQISLNDPTYTPGRIRSTVVALGTGATGAVYFTSEATADGLLWKIAQNDLLTISQITNPAVVKGAVSNVSTPVISANNLIYVGGAEVSYTPPVVSSGVVDVFDTSLTNVATLYIGDPVQSSPIVYSVTATGARVDYIYFTTNSGSGAGYCYYNDIDGSDIDEAWTYANTSGNPYSVQGMSSDNGYVVWGDDGNNLYIAHS
jgi:hypothetical protein